MDKIRGVVSKAATLVAGAIFALVFLYHWLQIALYAIDVPYMDDWALFPESNALPWLWKLHNEHRIITTKLLILLLWRLNGWDVGVNLVLNFAIYGAALAALYQLLRRGAGAPPWLILAFLLFTLSPRSAEIHHWAMTVQFHLVLLFFFLGAALLFQEREGRQEPKRLLGALALLITAMYSFGGGVPAVGALLPVYLIWKVRTAAANKRFSREHLTQLAVVAVPLALVLISYFLELQHAADTSARVPIGSAAFWKFLFLVVANGLGLLDMPGTYVLKGLFGLAVVFVPWIMMFARRKSQPLTPGLWAIFGVSVGVVAMLASTAAGRAAWGLDRALAWRYTELTMMLLPLIACGWWLALRDFRRPKYGVLAALYILFGIGFLQSWPVFGDYAYTYFNRRNDARVLSVCWAAKMPACHVPNLNGSDVRLEDLARARDLNLSFMSKVERNDWN